MQKEKLVPEIRFKGFEEEWSCKRIDDIFDEYSLKNNNQYPLLSIKQGIGTVLREESGRTVKSDAENISNLKLVHKGSLIMHLRSFEGGLEKANHDGLVSPAYHIFKSDCADTEMYYYYFRRKKFINTDLNNHVYGIRDGRSIDINGFNSILIPYTSLLEQNKIGQLIVGLDFLIQSQELKLKKLNEVKQSFLSKMFASENQKFPEIRFKGFEEEWSCKRIDDIFDEYSLKNNNQYPLLSIKQGIGTVLREESGRTVKSDAENISNLKLVHKGSLIMHLRSFEGGLEKANHDGLVSPAYHIFKSDCADTEMYYYYFRRKKFINTDLNNHVYGIRDGRSIDINGFNSILVPYTSRLEQNKIGQLIVGLDSLIKSQELKLKKLNNIKQALLEKMFC
ncbi:hypothetical protein ACM0IS_01425 [Mycoplasma aquilae ATCC BAA-1896]|uniref:hypothetical protein n=1 Tax=Mycoplasma aquilae TaxID=1312741 RepID=UPI003A8C46DE